jgi:transglutaminase-like putative cysteine protease
MLKSASIGILFIPFMTLCSLSFDAHARWAKPDDVDYSVEYRNFDVWVKSDGTYMEEVEEEITILKDSARISRGMMRLNYNPEVSSLEVLVAETLKEDATKLPVDKSLIEDKPLASSGEGFDQWHQVLVAFPAVDVGSKVHIKYRLKWFQVPAPDFYSDSITFGTEYQKSVRVKLRSQLPIVVKTNDPENQLKISRSGREKGEYPNSLEVQLKKPFLKTVVDEPDPLIDYNSLPYVEFSSSRDWSTVSKSVGAQYESTLNSPLPSKFQKIADAARGIADPIERLNLVTSRLADQVRYLGDWRTLKGKWVPRPLKTIASSQFGDCKDFSASIAAIARNIGMKAEVAWVWRGWNPVRESYELPTTHRFNHAIARIQSGDKVFWIDGTNVASFAQGIPGDISDRPALILSPDQARVERLPTNRPEDFSYSFAQIMDFSKPGGVGVQATFKSQGGDAASWINGNLNTSKDTLDYKIVRSTARTENVSDWKVEGFKIKSRIVGELTAKLRYTEKAQGYQSTAGSAYPIIPPDAINRFLMNVDQRQSDIGLGEPFAYEREMLFTQLNVVGEENLACAIDSPWVTIKREVDRVPSGIRIHDKLQLKKELLTHAEYSKAEFSKLQQKIVSCFRFSSLIYKAAGDASKKPLN